VNVVKLKKLTNFRNSTKEDFLRVRPFRKIELEDGLEYIEMDELVEVTPTDIRLRKRLLHASDRKRESRK
jgi:GTP-binding protein